jgi:Copper amine oxidase N-terminal domain
MEKLGAFVEYESATRTVTARRGSTDIILQIGNRNARVNGQDRLLDVPAQTISGTTMVPLRFMGEALGADIKWDGVTQLIAISTTDTGGGNTGGGNTGGGNTGGSDSVAIAAFNVVSEPWLNLGESASFLIQGTPGGSASVIISGVQNPVNLTEGPAGTYRGTWSPSASVFLKESSIIGMLKVGSAEKLIQAAKTISADAVAPEIRNALPTGNVNVGVPDISASYGDLGSGIDTKGVTLRVGGVDVTKQASITSDFIFYRPANPLKNGTQNIELIVKDLAGNSVSAKWNFALNSKTNAVVTIFDHTARQGVEPMGNIGFRLDTTPGSRVVIYSENRVINNLVMKESPAGVYRVSYRLKQGDQFNNDRVYADITLPDGTKFTTEAVKRILRVGSKTFGPAVVTSPKPNEAASNPLVVTGTALAGNKVNVRVSYATTMLNTLRVTGNLADVTVDVDANGNWKTSGIDLGATLRGSNTEYTVVVTAIDPANNNAKATAVTIKLKG